MTNDLRQFRVTHLATGLVQVVNVPVRHAWRQGHIPTERDHARAAQICGWRWVADCIVRVVPRGQEMPLPFDDLPLLLVPRDGAA